MGKKNWGTLLKTFIYYEFQTNEQSNIILREVLKTAIMDLRMTAQCTTLAKKLFESFI